jgi:hypothetical protein
MNSRIVSLLFLLIISGIPFSSLGCVPLKQFNHAPPLATNIHRIEVGRSTRRDVFQYFGSPDIEADSTITRVNLTGPLGRFWGQHFRASKEWADSLPYASIDEDHVNYLYIEIEIRDSFELLWPDNYFYAIGSYRSSIRKNKLLIRVNKHTDVVEMVSYLPQF